MNEEHRDAERIRQQLPDYFKAIEMPWHFAVSFLSKFVSDDEEILGVPGAHARNLFHAAKALHIENAALTAKAMELEVKRGDWVNANTRLAERVRVLQEALKRPCGCKFGLHDSMLLGPELRCHQVKAIVNPARALVDAITEHVRRMRDALAMGIITPAEYAQIIDQIRRDEGLPELLKDAFKAPNDGAKQAGE